MYYKNSTLIILGKEGLVFVMIKIVFNFSLGSKSKIKLNQFLGVLEKY